MEICFCQKDRNASSKYMAYLLSKAKGRNVWGLDKKIYRYAFLVGPNTLGYANSRIDNEVIKTIKRKYVQPNLLKRFLVENLSQYIHGPTKRNLLVVVRQQLPFE